MQKNINRTINRMKQKRNKSFFLKLKKIQKSENTWKIEINKKN